MLIIAYMLNGWPIMRKFICSLDLVSTFWLKEKFFGKKDFDFNNNPIHSTFFFWLIQFFTFGYDKDIRATRT